MLITCYVSHRDLVAYLTGETLRRALPSECRASEAAGDSGAIRVEVPERTIRWRAPVLASRVL